MNKAAGCVHWDETEGISHLLGGVQEDGEVDELAVSLDQVAQRALLEVPASGVKKNQHTKTVSKRSRSAPAGTHSAASFFKCRVTRVPRPRVAPADVIRGLRL